MPNFAPQALSNISVSKFAHKAGILLKKNPFWVLVIGSLGIHTAFAVIAPSPLKKEINKEVPIVTLPVVKLPNKPQVNLNTPKPDKSFLDSLFVKPSTKKPNLNNGLPNTLSDNPLRALDFSNLDKLDNLPPVITGLPTDIPPLFTNPKDFSPPQFVQPQTRNPLQPAFRLDNSNTRNSSSNLRPEFQGGLKSDITPNPPDNNKIARNTSEPKTPTPPRSNPPLFKSTQSPQTPKASQTTPPSSQTTDNKPSPPTTEPPSPPVTQNIERSGISLLDFLATDKRIRNLRDKNLLKETLIAPEEALIPNPELYREKGVAWIPPKVINVGSKTGTIIYYWVVSPYGEVQLAGYANGNKDLVDLDPELVSIVNDTVKDYKFLPIENPQSGIYRLVTAKYVFPYRY